MKKVLLLVAALVLATSTGAFAGTSATGSSVKPTLQISATIQSAVSLTLATGTTAGVNHCSVATGATTDYSMNFGNVDALAVNTGNCNVFAPATPGTSNAVYWSDYNVLPVYTSQTSFAGTTVGAQVLTDFGKSNIFVVRSATPTDATTPTGAASFSAMTVGSDDIIGAAGVASGTSFTRFLGVAVKPDNGAAVGTGLQTATVQFTLTVQ